MARIPTKIREIPKSFQHEFHRQTAIPLGSQIAPRLETVPRDLSGFPLHARGMVITLVLSVTTVAATMPVLMAGYKLWNALRVSLTVGQHRFLPDISAVHLFQDSRRMQPHHAHFGAPADLADADTSNVATVLRMYVPFALPAAPHGAEYDGVIPIAMLRDGDMVVQIGSGSDLSHAGVTYTVTSLAMEFELEPLPRLRVPTAWAVRRAQAGSLNDLLFQPSGFLYYLSLMEPTINTPLIDPALYGRVEVAVGSGQLRSMTIEQLQNQYALAVTRALGLSIAQVSPVIPRGDAANTAPDTCELIRPYWRDLVSRQPKGAVKISLPDKSGSLTSWGVTYRERGTRYDRYRQEVYARLGVSGSASEVQVEVRSAKKSAPDHLVPHLDEAIYWPGQPFAALEPLR